jgi:hypothetical protein
MLDLALSLNAGAALMPLGGGGGVSAPVNTVLPAISGTPTQGQTLSVSNGTWTNSPTSYAYQWKASGSNISGATSSTYLLTASEVGATITCTVTATNAGGSASATSAATGAVASSGLPTFTFEAETTALATAFTVAPTTRRKKSMNWAIKTLKDAGVYSKLMGFWKVGADEQSSAINWINPGTFNLVKVGAPTYVADIGYTGVAGGYLRTGINLTNLTPSTCFIGFWSNTQGITTPSDVGAIDASTNGLSLIARSTGGIMSGRIGGANVTPLDTNALGDGWYVGSRASSTSVIGYKGTDKRSTTASNSTALASAIEITFLGLNNNGTVGTSGKQQGCWAIGHGLTDADHKVLAAVATQLNREFQYGGLDIYEAGYLPATATYDVIVYGATSGGAIAAYEAARQGLTVAIVGGWRDRNIGGMAASGLGWTDWNVESALKGLPRWVLTQIQAMQGTASTTLPYDPQNFGHVLRRMLDPSKANGLDIPVYWSNGVVSCTKTGTVVNTITTADGRTFTANTGFIDASYEGDLITVAGCTTIIGREAAGTGKEALNGFIGTTSNPAQQPSNHAGTNVNVDPWLTPGNTGSGMLPGLVGILGVDSPAVGAADASVQNYNFRLTGSATSSGTKFPTTAPPGYSAATYEGLGRLFAIDATLTIDDIFKIDNVQATASFSDINNRGGFSTDFYGAAMTYPAASYSARETIWAAHKNYTLGLIYYLQYEADARIPAGVRTSALALRLSGFHYTRPHPNDDYNWPFQMYIRETRRLVGDYIHNGNDIAAADGTTPRSVKTIAVASYAFDSHGCQSWAHNNAGTWRVYNEGGIAGTGSGGSDQISPLPLEAVLPKAAEITNVCATFTVSATHVGIGAIRMEFTHMLLSQAAACMMAERKANANVALQSLNYTNLRTRLLATPSLTGEVAPSLPQLN